MHVMFYLTLFAITILGKVQVMVYIQKVSVPKVLGGPNTVLLMLSSSSLDTTIEGNSKGHVTSWNLPLGAMVRLP